MCNRLLNLSQLPWYKVAKYQGQQYMHRRGVFAGLAALCAGFAAAKPTRAPAVDLEVLRALLRLPDSQIDLTAAKLTIDRMIDPGTNAPWVVQKLDGMAREVRSMLLLKKMGGTVTSAEKVEALRAYLYTPGSWNQNTVYKYDLVNDPTGKKILSNKLIEHYLRNRLGNCVSMPILFLLLANRLEIDATLATAPEHFFIKYRDDEGPYKNAETTHDGGLKRDSSYQKEFEITPEAVDNGLYLRALPKKESAAVMMGTLLEHLTNKRDFTSVHKVCDLILSHYPRSIEAILFKAGAISKAFDDAYRSKYKAFDEIPTQELSGAKEMLRSLMHWGGKAESLGWKPPSKEFEAASERLVRNARRLN